MYIDTTISITVVIAISAIISPVITALINNHHRYRIKKLELEHETASRREAHSREVFEKYILAAGSCLYGHGKELHAEFGARSGLAIYHVSDKTLRTMMEQLEHALHENYYPQKELIVLFEKITALLRIQQETPCKLRK